MPSAAYMRHARKMNKRRDEFSTMCATKKGRDICAAHVITMALRLGATFERKDRPDHREIYLCLAYGPYRVSMHFEGGSQVGAFLGHWHTATSSAATYPKTFAVSIGGTVNEYHWGKATTCKWTFDAFLESLECGFAALQNAALACPSA